MEGQEKKLVFLVCMVLAFSVLNGTMFNVAIPDIAKSFDLLPSQVSWVLTAYIVVFAVGSLLYGKLADIYSIRTIFTFGIALFSTGAFIGFISINFEMLLVARIIQALGGATIPALAFLIPIRFLPHIKGKVFGMISSTVAFASGVGPIFGGIIGGMLNWRFMFLLAVSSAITIPLFLKWLPKEEKKQGKIDYLGALLVGLFIVNLLLYITSFNVYFLLLFVLFFSLFIWRTKKVEQPFIDPLLFKNQNYLMTILTSFLSTAVLFGLIFLMPIMLRDVYHLSTIGIGFVLFPGAFLSGMVGQIIGSIIDRRGGIPVLKTALVLISSGLFLLSTFAGSFPWLLAICLMVAYVGFPLMQSSTADLLSDFLESHQQGVGLGLFNLLNFTAGALSSTIIGKILDQQTTSVHLNLFNSHEQSFIYSNVLIGLVMIALIAFIFFSYSFTKKKRHFPSNEIVREQ
ncbi:MFS transporter [Bacillus carboniphilus]|uniref:MFS transporter n=1 Tax=Bacillus carboniphilus TaxID=86663 RepID=A0ABY9JUJ1_9BACI|nr:MFS transporter [Bacillus carboniphilus]WLR43074.1 MFS transporter [Bacillus carboniphilus]